MGCITKINFELKNFFKDLSFIEETHVYSVNNQPLKYSVSKLISNYGNKFNTEIMSEAVANRDNILKENVIAKWDKERDNSIIKGNSVHYFAEEYLKNKNLKPITKQQELVVSFLNSIPSYIQIVFSELQMYHKKFMFGGTCDLLLYNTLTGKFILLDWKTNKDIHKNYKGQTLLLPFNHLLDTPFNKYQLQLSYYQILLQQIENLEIEDRKIVWFKDTGYEMYSCKDYTKELFLELEKNVK